MLDLKNLQTLIEQRYISVQKHPTLDLYIYNYTQKAQFDRVWNNETLHCRGLIMDAEHNIVARPFPKFFNLQEFLDQGGQIPAEDFIVTEKMDGSLGILYMDADGRPSLTTRGSFTSDQAVKGTEILRTKYPHALFSPDLTYLFEIIYPSNRIVVDYGELEDLVLLAAIDTQTGKECIYDFIKECAHSWGMPVVDKYDAIRDFTTIEQRPNSEGYVISFHSTGQRFKIKFDEYVRLHRLVTGVNARTIWDLLRNNQPFDELLERVPDEFYSWVKKTTDNLSFEYRLIERLCIKEYERVKDLPTRKDQALEIMKNNRKYSGIVFSMLDNRPYDAAIWKLLKPAAERPFKEEV